MNGGLFIFTERMRFLKKPELTLCACTNTPPGMPVLEGGDAEHLSPEPEPRQKSDARGAIPPSDCDLAFHPISNVFALLEGQELDHLVADIKEHGLLHPIWIHPADGSIIDGRNRYVACKQAGVEPVFKTWDGDGSLIDFIISMNLKRRHLSSGQRAALAVELLPMLEKAGRERMAAGGGDKKSGRQKVAHPIPNRGKSTDKAAKLANVNRLYVSEAKKLKESQPDVYADVRAGRKTLSEARVDIRNKNRQAIADQIRLEPQPLPEGPFRVVVIDPPWTYEESGNNLPYPTMTIDAIKALPIGKLAHDDCVLWLWTTNAHHRLAYDVLDAWGFEYKNILTWVKDVIGTGHWLRGQTEHCMLAARGKPIFLGSSHANVIHGPRREHSRKPEQFYEHVEATCPGNRVELFSRQKRDGWCAWGAETNRFTADDETDAQLRPAA